MRIELERESVAAGERLRGVVTVGRAGLQELKVGLLYREESCGFEATVTQELAPGFDGARDLASGTALPFEILVPADAPPSVRSRHGGLFWEVVATTDRVGSGGTASCRVEVTA